MLPSFKRISPGAHAPSPSADDGETRTPSGNLTTAFLRSASAIRTGSFVCGETRSNVNPAGLPALVVCGLAVSVGLNGTSAQPTMPTSGPKTDGGNGYPGESCVTQAADLNTPGFVHESIRAVVVRPTPASVHEVGLRRKAVSGEPFLQNGPPRDGGACPEHARSGSWTGSAGTPQNVIVVPASAIASDKLLA